MDRIGASGRDTCDRSNQCNAGQTRRSSNKLSSQQLEGTVDAGESNVGLLRLLHRCAAKNGNNKKPPGARITMPRRIARATLSSISWLAALQMPAALNYKDRPENGISSGSLSSATNIPVAGMCSTTTVVGVNSPFGVASMLEYVRSSHAYSSRSDAIV